MKLKKTWSIVLAVMITFSLVACGSQNNGGGEAEDAAKPIEFKVAYVDAEDSPTHLMMLDAETQIEEATDGKVDVQLYPNGIMGGDREVLEGILLGTLQMTYVGSSIMSGYGDKFSIFEVPFLFKDYEAVTSAYDGELGQMYNEWLGEHDFQCLGIATFGWKGLSNSVRPVSSPEDMKGMKVRVMEVPLFIDTFKALGANATPMSWGEVYTGLQQGTIEAQDNSPELTYTSKFYEVQKYYTNLNHVQGNGLLIVQKSYMEGLPEDVQTVISETFSGLIEPQRERSVAEEKGYIQKMVDGGIQYTELTEEQRDAFIQKVKPVHDAFRQKVGDEVFDLALSYSK